MNLIINIKYVQNLILKNKEHMKSYKMSPLYPRTKKAIFQWNCTQQEVSHKYWP